MNRIDQCFTALKKQQQAALITFITAGDPTPDITVKTMHALVKGGAAIIEIGVPFSDPGADGKAIQGANERALRHNVGLKDVFVIVAEFRQTDKHTPIVLMGYVNPVENMGYAEFARQAATAGVDGVITVDLPPEESEETDKILLAHNIYPIYLIAPTSTSQRIKLICSRSHGFIYFVAVKGVTGDKKPDFNALDFSLIRKHSNLPIAIGFGIRDRQTVSEAIRQADAAVVGSAIVNIMAHNENDPQKIPMAVEELVRDLTSQL